MFYMKNFTLLAVIFTAGISSCKKESGEKDKKESQINADAQIELNNSAAFVRSVADADFEFNFSKLPQSGGVDNPPYSGFWYPQSAGGTNAGKSPYDSLTSESSPLVKYDEAFYGAGQRVASVWEANNHSAQGSTWAGHCNGFSAASARHKEPIMSVDRNGVRFSPSDVKALLAEIYMGANYVFLGGKRCESPYESQNPDYRHILTQMDDCEDVNPASFHVVIANWIGIQKKTLVFDKSVNHQVWNYPLYKFNSSSSDIDYSSALNIIGSRRANYAFNPRAKKFKYVKTTVTYSDALGIEVAPNGSTPKTLTVSYILELDASGDIIGGEWSSASRSNHPDFIWVPLEAMKGTGHIRSSNPKLDVDKVLDIWAESAGYGSIENAPELLVGGSWQSKWGRGDGYNLSIDGGDKGAVFLMKENILEIKRQLDVPALRVELNGSSLSPMSEDTNTQIFVIKPVEGINRLKTSHVVSGKEFSKITLFYTIR